MTAPALYSCCRHIVLGCPSSCDGHSQPCTECRQTLTDDDDDRRAARAMNAHAHP